jgi:hypothetical protein
MTYWSYLDDSIYGNHGTTVAKWGPIYVNQCGGWMPKSAAKVIHKTVTQKNFPVDNSI